MMSGPVARDAAATGAREGWEGVGVRTPTPLAWGRSPVDAGAPPASAEGMATRRRIATAPGCETSGPCQPARSALVWTPPNCDTPGATLDPRRAVGLHGGEGAGFGRTRAAYHCGRNRCESSPV